MTHTYELVIYANWGISSPERVSFGTDKGKAIRAYKESQVGGNGNVVRVTLAKDGMPWLSKYLMK